MTTATPAAPQKSLLQNALRRPLVLSMAALAVALIIPLTPLIGNYGIYILTLALIYSIPTTGLTLFMGYTGQFSLGQAAFFGVGAYAAVNVTKAGLPFLLALVFGTVMGTLFSLLLGAGALRLRGFYLAVATLAIGLIGYQLFKNLDGLTGGVSGFGQIPIPRIGALTLESSTAFYYFSLAVLVAVLVITVALVRSPAGMMMRAIAANELGAQSVGINTYAIKVAIFTLAGAYAGLAGAMFAYLNSYIAPDDFGLIFSISLLTMAIVGGPRSFIGGFLGALIVTTATEELRVFPELQPILHGAALILLVRFFPGGIAGMFDRRARRLAPQG